MPVRGASSRLGALRAGTPPQLLAAPPGIAAWIAPRFRWHWSNHGGWLSLLLDAHFRREDAQQLWRERLRR